MIDQPLSSKNLRAVSQMRKTPARESVRADRVGRMIQITLALYLMPVLLVVVALSGAGMMILGVSDSIHVLGERVKRVAQGNGKSGL